MSIVTINTHLLHYEALGRGQPVLFLHGWLGSWRYWWPTMQGLSAKHRSFAVDLWGFGDSSRVPEQYTMEAYEDLLDQFIESLGIATPLTLVGHGLGAAVSLRYSCSHPEKVSRLATIALPTHGSHVHHQLQKSSPQKFLKKVLNKTQHFNEVKSEVEKTDNNVVTNLLQEMQSHNYAGNALDCSRPMLIIYGGADIVVPPPTKEYDYLTRPNGKRQTLIQDDWAHFPMLQDPPTFNRLLLDFIQDDRKRIELKDYWKRRTR